MKPTLVACLVLAASSGGQQMKTLRIAVLMLAASALLGCGARSSVRLVDRTLPPHNNQVCMLSGTVPAGMLHSVVGQIQQAKQTYGSVDEVLEEMAEQARLMGANVIVGLNARQHFGGPLIWKMVRPIGHGTAIKVNDPIDCAVLGGVLR